MNDGWVLLHRKFIEWEWFSDANMVKLFVYLLLKANHADGKWQGIDIKRGQLLTGLESMSKSTNLSVQQLRTCLSKLEKSGEITNLATNKYRVISICNYDSYQQQKQAINRQGNKQATSKQQASNKQATANKEEEKKNKELKEEEVYRHFDHLTISKTEFDKLIEEGNTKQSIDDILDSIENYKKNKTYTSLYLTAKKWLKSEQLKNNQNGSTNKAIDRSVGAKDIQQPVRDYSRTSF